MTVTSTLRRTKDEYHAMEKAKANLGFKPPVDFWKPASNRDEDDADDYKYNKESYTTVSIPLNVDGAKLKDKPKYERHVKVFCGGTAEEFCNHLHVCEELYTKLGYDKSWKHVDKTTDPHTHYWTDCMGIHYTGNWPYLSNSLPGRPSKELLKYGQLPV